MTDKMPSCNIKNKMYSGYLSWGEDGKEHHYVYVEALNMPDTAPLMIWFNGGPGCSSMSAFMQEHGPCVFYEDWSKEPQDNPEAWTDDISIIYMESPSQVGYNNNVKEYKFDDKNVGFDNLEAVKKFFELFPELKAKDLYLSGESYAGIYVPHLAKNILDFNKDASEEDKINLIGFIIGNAVTHWKYDCDAALVKMAYARGLISLET